MRLRPLLFALAASSACAWAQVPPADEVCCRASTQQLIDETRSRIAATNTALAAAQQAMRACDTRVSSAPCPADVLDAYQRCASQYDGDLREFCRGPSEEQCKHETDAEARETCVTLASIDCQRRYENHRIISGVAHPGNPCVAERDRACPTVQQACRSERAELNRQIARLSELNTGLARISMLPASPAPGCVQLSLLDFENERLCDPRAAHPDLVTKASYSCVRNGRFECVFIGCRELLRTPKPPPPQTIPVNIGGQDIRSSGLQGGPNNYYTDYTVAFSARIGSGRLAWNEDVRVPGSRSWYGFHYSACTRVPLREYCAATDRLAFVRGIPRPPHNTNCH